MRKNESFHESIQLVLFVAQWFSVMPVKGIWSKNLSAITFKLWSFHTIASMVLIVFVLMEVALSVSHAFDFSHNLSSFGRVAFSIEVILGLALLLHLAQQWGGFMRFWAAREDCFLNAPYKEKGLRLKFKIKMVAITFYVMAAAEHLMYLISAVDFAYKRYTMCKITKITFIKYLFYEERIHVFKVLPFNFFSVVLIFWLTITATFCWNFTDILIIVMSIALTRRFNQLNDRVVDLCENPQRETFWTEIREHYVKLIQIKEKIDSEMAYLILLSCGSNLISLVLKIFQSFSDIPFLLNKIYFWYTLGFLILRTFSVFYSSALIYEASKKPIQVLRHFPAKHWNGNVQRFMDMVKGETVVLSANRFFYLTKSMILGMVGTIITYELVLVQEVTQDPEQQSFCNITRFNISSI